MSVESIISDLKTIKKVFDKFNVRMIVVYGACLGWYRDKNFLPGDDDIDLAVIDPINFETRKRIGHALTDLGFIPDDVAFNVFDRWEKTEPGYNGDDKSGIMVLKKNFKFTIFFFKEENCAKHGNEYVCIPRMGTRRLISTPKKFYEKLGIIKIKGDKYLCPSPIEEYLSFTYFNDWKNKNDRRHGELYDEMHK
jgi:hypothetical protein